jgi:hypothetical protein
MTRARDPSALVVAGFLAVVTVYTGAGIATTAPAATDTFDLAAEASDVPNETGHVLKTERDGLLDLPHAPLSRYRRCPPTEPRVWM